MADALRRPQVTAAGPAIDGGGLRHNEDKNPLELIPPRWIWDLGLLFKAGAKKYARNNWLRGMSYANIEGCLMRHFLKWRMGESHDPETGLHHLVHVAWNALALVTYSDEKYKQFDDREFKEEDLDLE